MGLRHWEMLLLKAAGCCVVGLGLVHCGAPEELQQETQEVVYGTDDRTDVYAHASADLRALAQQSIVALMPSGAVNTSNPSAVRFSSATLGESHSLCASERFVNDPTAAFCSGTLISPDLVLTAGHCVEAPGFCSDTKFVFGYYRDSESSLHPVTSEDVYGCREVVASRNDAPTTVPRLDYAVVRLDRSALPRQRAATVRTASQAVTQNASIAVIGFGSGIPAKIDSGGTVRSPNASTLDFFVTNTDTFGGNSGSGVFDTTTLQQVGILVRGAQDYIPGPSGTCNVVNVCSNTGCSGESVTYVFQAINALCRAAPNEAICGAGFCGDGVCQASETTSLCAADCGGTSPPASWTCGASLYNDGAACDCDCGAVDPDCNNTALAIRNCAAGATCSAGVCVGGRQGCSVVSTRGTMSRAAGLGNTTSESPWFAVEWTLGAALLGLVLRRSARARRGT